jgi:predicted dehydrogenase
MTSSRICLVIGYGSIGARHTRVLEALGCEVHVVSRRPGVHARRHATVAAALTAVPRADYAVIGDETSRHAATLRALEAGGFRGTIVVEKPLANPGDQVVAPAHCTTVVAYQLRFDPLMRKLEELLRGQTIISADIRACSYLPGWRPRDYRQTESASKAAGGGVLRDMSHELDYALWLLGPWRRVTAIGGRLSSLEIDSDDSWAVLFEASRCRSVVLTLNYLDRLEERWIVVNTDRATIKADIYNRTLTVNGDTIFTGSPADVDQTYLDENCAMLAGRFEQACSFEAGLAVVNLIGAIEAASREGRWVSA